MSSWRRHVVTFPCRGCRCGIVARPTDLPWDHIILVRFLFIKHSIISVERIKNTDRARTEDCFCLENGEKVSIRRVRDGRYRATNELRYELVEDERRRNASFRKIKVNTITDRQPV